ncbi:hypothetical protein RxyAA322_22290 [Rubrobacter xylanophilus]|uniref:L-aspartate oxidase n=1 Tax=Rubrobacter xylanophilus TaxID=49319 RepID=A0A510HM15_9ACTN|nr:FAD-dependent oxidoreductase [Rubrobacter xylanophilus]BBL80375.1 hypothetical protein RxyAA322_22290 [Rubrobacter xylanophilus]
MLVADVVVVGSGVAGCAAALAAARRGAEVALLAKHPDPAETNTRYAQGGIVYTGPGDSPEALVRDVLAAGGGDRAAAELLAREGPPLVGRLLVEELGVPFDRDGEGRLDLALEAAHSVPRIVHCADATGERLQRVLLRAVDAERRITVLPGLEALRLAIVDGRCAGVYAAAGGRVEALSGGCVVLATGGLAGLYGRTTNPPGATGDGYALALRAGARVRDLHYVQFHPTAFWAPEGEPFLISEAARGAGGVLRGPGGEEFIRHPAGSLAPRDVISHETIEMMSRTGSPCAYLDMTHLPEDVLRERFPGACERCLRAGVDMAREPVPVSPAAHYSCGGIATDLSGRSSLPGLFAAGEVASTGLHGANRLASTSLLEGLLFGWRAGEAAAEEARSLPSTGAPPVPSIPLPEPAPGWAREELGRLLWEHAGPVRTVTSLEEGLRRLRELGEGLDGTDLGGPLLVAEALVRQALSDRRSRGCHRLLDLEEVRP